MGYFNEQTIINPDAHCEWMTAHKVTTERSAERPQMTEWRCTCGTALPDEPTYPGNRYIEMRREIIGAFENADGTFTPDYLDFQDAYTVSAEWECQECGAVYGEIDWAKFQAWEFSG